MRRGLSMLLFVVACTSTRERPDAGCFDDSGACGGIHPPGMLDQDSPAFHGKLVESRGWDLGFCGSCHGDDFGGQATAVSCRTAGCHAEAAGPAACGTCHEAVPTTGAHTTHLALAADCANCHVVPATWDAPGHILGDGPPVEVTITGLAEETPRAEDRAGPPAWEPATSTCANVYCHGDVFGDAAAALTRPAWHGGATQASCGTCHGRPPSTHAPVAETSCATCHPADAPHVDGLAQIGREDSCAGCHGGDGSPAPPIDLAGNVFTTAPGVGAHRSHLEAANRISKPVPCASCHLVPDEVGSPGHIDTVGPAEVVLTAGGWNRESETCAGTACHGPAQPTWTRVDLGEAACGTCHDLPPAAPWHEGVTTINQCVTCHPSTVDGFGNIRVDGPAGDESEHIDGDVDL